MLSKEDVRRNYRASNVAYRTENRLFEIGKEKQASTMILGIAPL